DAHLVHVRGISVVRGHDGTNVEIRASGTLTPKILTLKSPDRLVIDLPNALPESRPHNIPVHASDVNMVRMSEYQAEPPTTRVVLDLRAPQDFQLATLNDKLIVKLRPLASRGMALPVAGTTGPLSAPANVTAIPKPIVTGTSAAANMRAQDFVGAQPQYHEVTRKQEAQQDQTAAERASEAAKILGAA